MRAARIVAERPDLRAGAGIRLAAAQTKPPPARRRMGHAAIWGGLGFVTGAVFWHAVGFWTFVSDAVLSGVPKPGIELNAGQTLAQQGPLSDIAPDPRRALPTIFMVDPTNCTALELDRRSNSTAQRPCPENGLALRLEPETGRDDLAVLTYPRIQAARYPAN